MANARHHVLALLACSALASMAATPVFAQNVGAQFARNKVVDVRTRPRPGYQAIGKQVGAFTVYPKVTSMVTSDDNVYAQQTATSDDVIGSLIVEAVAAADWSRNDLLLNAKVKRDEYASLGKESNTAWTLGASGQLDIQRDFAATGAVKWDHLSEARSASGVPTTTRDPVRFDVGSVDLGTAKAFNRLRVSGTFAFRDYKYDDAVDVSGTLIDQSYRNRKTYAGSAKLDYAVTPDTAVFLEVRGDRRRYDNTSVSVVGSLRGAVNIAANLATITQLAASNGDVVAADYNSVIAYLRTLDGASLTANGETFAISTTSRDSDGTQINLGIDFEPTDLIRGQVRIGSLKQTYANPLVRNTSNSSFNGQIQWLATPLTNATFTVSRQVADSGIALSPTILTTSAGVQIDHELLRNVLLTAKYDYSAGKFSGIDRDDKRTSASFGAVYLVNRNVGLSVLYTYLDQTSSGLSAATGYTINRVSASLVLQY